MLSRIESGVLTYNWYASLHQRPNVQIRQSGTPAADAVLAAPILKLCVEKWASFKPEVFASNLIALLRDCLLIAPPNDH